MKSEGSAITGKVVIVTGAGQGIGTAIVKGFVRAGAKAAIAEIDEEAGRKAERYVALRQGSTLAYEAGSLAKTRFCYTLVLAAIRPVAAH